MIYPSDEPYHITIEIVNKQCKVAKMVRNLGMNHFKVIDVRGFSKRLVRHLVRMPAKQFDKIPKGLVKKQRGDRSKGEISGWIDSSGCDVCNAIVSRGSLLISGRSVESDTIVYTFIAPDYDAFKVIMSTLEDLELQPKILAVGKYQSKGRILTTKQERALWFALKTGFFDYPRKINAAELSRRLGIRASTLSEINRRGIHRLLEHHFET